MRTLPSSRLIAIVGGSGSGKTWLAEYLQKFIDADARRLSQDDFYRDRSSLTPAQREKLNFDHPRSIDWPLFRRTLKACRMGRSFERPSYNFVTHTRSSQGVLFHPKPLTIVEGLWLLWRPSLRSIFDLRIFINCSLRMRLDRRLSRDVAERGRSRLSIRRQFLKTVVPMHRRFVSPQARWANFTLESLPSANRLRQLVNLTLMLKNSSVASNASLERGWETWALPLAKGQVHSCPRIGPDAEHLTSGSAPHES